MAYNYICTQILQIFIKIIFAINCVAEVILWFELWENATKQLRCYTRILLADQWIFIHQ